MKTNSVPKIRFKGFTDDWEQCKLGEVVEDYIEKTTVEDQYPVLTSSQQKGIVLQEEYFAGDRVSQNGNIGYFVIPRGYFAFRSRSDNDTFVFNRNDAVDMGIISYFYPVFKPKGVDSDFLLRRLNYGLENQIRINSEGTGQHVLSLKKFKNMIGSFPSYEEQQKIGEYFSNLDHLITLHQRKCEQTKELKKFMLQKMFPKKGEKNPEIRFPGFTDDWEQRKLESLCEVFTDGDWIEAKDQSNSGVRLIQTGNIGITEYLDKENNKKWISEETFKRLRCEEVYPGDILISRLPDPAGRACILPNLGIRMITAVDCTIIRTSKEYDSEYLVQYLSTPTYFKIVNSFLGGGTRQRISRKNLSKIDIPVPHIFAEQQKIGEYFSNLDHLITLHQRKCEQLKELKKFMLQNMFPKKG
jgi:type I restriction enzyme S subunit